MAKTYLRVVKGKCRCGGDGEVVVKGRGKNKKNERVVGYHCPLCDRKMTIDPDKIIRPKELKTLF